MKYDLIVIGGGPAGMIAAGRAAELGARVLLLEKNKFLGAKLLITGKGRCNLTNQTSDLRELVKAYGANGKFLYSAFSRFGVDALIDFFNDKGLATKVERGQRVFPESDRSVDVRDVLSSYLRETGVEVRLFSAVDKLISESGLIKKVILKTGHEFAADKFIIATGGKSYPGTGSTGEAYEWLRALGHSITSLRPSLAPLRVKEALVKRLEGLSLKNVEIGLYAQGRKIASEFGEAVFTADGLSGPIVLSLSQVISEQSAALDIVIDFKPALDWPMLDQRIQNDFKEAGNKQFKNILGKLLPQKLIPVIMELSGIDPDKKANLITREERKALLRLLKEFRLSFDGLAGFEKAIITAGGVSLSEVDPQTMASRLVKNMALAGEVLDLDGPTGGYNLQIAWSTGYVAGEWAVS